MRPTMQAPRVEPVQPRLIALPAAAQIDEILFPSDLTPASDRAFEHAALLAERLGARITLYHVLPAPPYGSREEPRREALRRARRDAQDHLERMTRERAAVSEILIEQEVSVHRGLLRALIARKPDLTVMATHGREWISQLFSGSVAETALNAARRPLLLVREPDHGVALPYRRILVPTDMTPASSRAFPIAAMLARAFDAEVIALHVAATPHGDPAFGTAWVSYEVESDLPSESALAAFLGDQFAGVKIRPHVLMGSAWGRILEVAKRERTDLIVMSTHGRDSMSDWVMGSHTERVVQQAPCPVIVV